MSVIDEFVARARAGRLTTSKPVTWNSPPADGSSVVVAERGLGIPLPPLLRERYLGDHRTRRRSAAPKDKRRRR